MRTHWRQDSRKKAQRPNWSRVSRGRGLKEIRPEKELGEGHRCLEGHGEDFAVYLA